MDRLLEIWRRWRFAILGGVVVFALLATAATVFVVRKVTSRDPYRMYVQGVKRLDEKDYQKALVLFKRAVQLAPTDTNYLLATARTAAAQGLTAEAAEFGRRAWEAGVRTPEQVRFLLDTFTSEDKAADLRAALKLVEQLPPNAAVQELRGDVLLHFGRFDEAMSLWLQLADTTPTSNLVSKVGAAYFSKNQPDEARKFLEQQRAKGHLDEPSFILLAALYLLDDKDHPKALEVFAEASRTPHYHDRLKLEHGVALVIHQKYPEARAVLDALKAPVTDATDNRFRTLARLFLGFLGLQQGQRPALEELAKLNAQSPKGPWKEGEELYLKALLAILDRQSGVIEDLRRAHRLIPHQAPIALVLADECLKSGHSGEAVTSCQGIPGTLSKWPPLLLAFATALHREGRNAEALAVLNQLHRRNLHSKDSLELLRDAAFGNRQLQVSDTAQKILEQLYPQDAEVKLYSSLSAMRAGAFDQAGNVLEDILQKHPGDVRLKLAQVQLQLVKGENEAALRAVQAIEGAPAATLPFRAMAHLRLRQWDAARDAFAKAVAFDQPTAVHLEYAKLLLQLDKPDEAQAQFQMVLKKSPDESEAKLGLALLAYQRKQVDEAREWARSMMAQRRECTAQQVSLLAAAEMRLGQHSNALNYCRVALAKDPNHSLARTLQGSLQSLAGRYAEAESDFKRVLQQQPDDLVVKQELAVLNMRRGNFAGALDFANQVLTARPDNNAVQLLRFEILAASGQTDQAGVVLDAIRARLTPSQQALAASWLAQLKKDTNAALALLEEELGQPEVAFRWAGIQLNRREEDVALTALRKQKFSIEQWASLADLAERQKLARTVVFCYEQALALAPNNPVLLNNWAWNSLVLGGGDTERIIDAGRRAAEALPREPSVLDTYAEALLRARRHLECISMLTAHSVVAQRHAQLQWQLGQAYEGANDLPNGLLAYRRCQDLLAAKQDITPRFSRQELEKKLALRAPARP
jgi:tetratricopeptide (TPR) repeat protein